MISEGVKIESLSVADEVLEAELPHGSLKVFIEHSELPPSSLFDLAARNNPKRAFLFLSHVLGKHLPVTPSVMADIHGRLARHVPDLPEPVVFIGMAETATSLGQGVFEAWNRIHPDKEAIFLHTTRYLVPGADPVVFEEAHSHAPLQWLHLPEGTALRESFRQARSLVLVDDEISTGNTFVNLARACQANAPEISHIHLSAITDFTGRTRSVLLAEQFDAILSIGSLLSGRWYFEPNGSVQALPATAQSHAWITPVIEDHGFGRLGRNSRLSLPQHCVEAIGSQIHPNDRVLVLGTGEFMHPAFVLARDLYDVTGVVVQMHATTRSPILSWGPIKNAITFSDNYGEGVPNFLYNSSAGQYDHVFICHETGPTTGLVMLARQLGARLLYFRSELEIEENPVH